MNAIAMPAPRELSAAKVDRLDPYAFFAVLGKRVIHSGGRTATEDLIRRAEFQPCQRVLDVGCGVGTTAIQVARQYARTSEPSTSPRSCSSALPTTFVRSPSWPIE